MRFCDLHLINRQVPFVQSLNLALFSIFENLKPRSHPVRLGCTKFRFFCSCVGIVVWVLTVSYSQESEVKSMIGALLKDVPTPASELLKNKFWVAAAKLPTFNLKKAFIEKVAEVVPSGDREEKREDEATDTAADDDLTTPTLVFQFLFLRFLVFPSVMSHRSSPIVGWGTSSGQTWNIRLFHVILCDSLESEKLKLNYFLAKNFGSMMWEFILKTVISSGSWDLRIWRPEHVAGHHKFSTNSMDTICNVKFYIQIAVGTLGS